MTKFIILNTKTGRKQKPSQHKMHLKTGKISKTMFGRQHNLPEMEACQHIGLYDSAHIPIHDKETVLYHGAEYVVKMITGAFGIYIRNKFAPFIGDEFIKDGLIMVDITIASPSKIPSKAKISKPILQEVDILQF